MMAQLGAWWQGLARRERRLVAAAAGVIVAALLYAVAIEPAWRTRARLARELPQLQAQLAEMEALREEARLLKQQGFGTDSSGSLRAGAQRSLARAGLAATLRDEGERGLAVSAAGVSAQAWFAWLEEFTRESRVGVVRARVERGGTLATSKAGAGMVRAEAGFEAPPR